MSCLVLRLGGPSTSEPLCPSTQYLRFLAPKTLTLMVFLARDFKHWVLGPSVLDLNIGAVFGLARETDRNKYTSGAFDIAGLYMNHSPFLDLPY